MMDGIGMELINFPTGPLVEVQVNWYSSGNWWYACFLYLVCDLMSFKSCLLQLSGIVYLKSSGSGHGTAAARDRGALFFWPTSGLHHCLSLSRLCSVNGEFPPGYKYTTGLWTPLLHPLPLSLIFLATGSFSPTVFPGLSRA